MDMSCIRINIFYRLFSEGVIDIGGEFRVAFIIQLLEHWIAGSNLARDRDVGLRLVYTVLSCCFVWV